MLYKKKQKKHEGTTCSRRKSVHRPNTETRVRSTHCTSVFMLYLTSQGLRLKFGICFFLGLSIRTLSIPTQTQTPLSVQCRGPERMNVEELMWFLLVEMVFTSTLAQTAKMNVSLIILKPVSVCVSFPCSGSVYQSHTVQL